MPKDIPVGNGNFLLNFDLDYQIRDVYFPQIGQENHSKGLPFRFGVWVDGAFSWVGSEWEKDLRYRDDSIVTQVTLRNDRLGLELRCSDAVDIDENIYIKKIDVYNLRDCERQARLFLSHNFHLYGNDVGDTAYYDPRAHCIIHYKANRYFLINCCADGVWGVRHYACGDKEVPGRDGTWKDAEDGALSGYPVAWGSADSTVGIWLDLPARRSSTGYYIIAAGQSYHEVCAINQEVTERGTEFYIKRTNDYWGAWVLNEPREFGDLPREIVDVFCRSLLILRTQIDNQGAILAANDSDIVRFGKDTYSYMWGRDGAYVAAALARAGYPHVCRKFFEFVAHVLTDEGYLFQHYNPDGSLASNWHPWLVDGKEVLPIQEDSTALVLWALWIHSNYSRDIEFIKTLYTSLIRKATDFLLKHVDPETHLPLPSYDLWEERYGTHTFTVSAVIAGLTAAAGFARLFHDEALAEICESAAGRMREGVRRHLYHKGLGRYARSGYRSESGYELDEVADISILGLVTLGGFSPDEPRIADTVEALKERLWVDTPIGGGARYENDIYQREADVPPDVPGNPWFISTLWFAEYYIARATSPSELHKAIPYLEWCARNALPSGVLAEQVHPLSGAPLSVSPLTWSHSAFVWAVLEYVDKFKELKGQSDLSP